MMDPRPAPYNPELTELLDAAVARLIPWRRTFSEEEALQEIWDHGYDLGPQADPRFILVQEGSGPRQPRQWRLHMHTLANNILLDQLGSGAWDGRDVDAALARLDAAAGGPAVFCPFDPRFITRAGGRLDRADHDQPPSIDQATAAALDALAPALLAEWQATGGLPRTVLDITSALDALGWPGSASRGSATRVRAWLHGWNAVQRVGQDYWVLTIALPRPPAKTRLQVLPVHSPPAPSPSSMPEQTPVPVQPQPVTPRSPATEVPEPRTDLPMSLAIWVVVLRTVHLVEGFLPVPAAARPAIPPLAPGSASWEVVKGMWFDTGAALWVWFDRQGNRLCGSDLAEQLAWCSAGARIQITWTPDTILFRQEGIDAAVQQQETRLVDVEALAKLRGGLGESYRRSLLAVLANEPDGLSLPDLVTAVSARQQHTVHPGTIRAILAAAGFEQREGRWFVGLRPDTGDRRFRRALLAAFLPDKTDNASSPPPRSLAEVARAVRERLEHIQADLRPRA
jgi:hypothetical protein